MMESSLTVTNNNTLEEYAALMARTTTRREDVSREKPLQFTGFSQLPTSAHVVTATNMLANLTTAFYFIPIQEIPTFGAVDISGLNAPFISPYDISSLGEATETHVLNRYNHFGRLFGNLEYPEAQFRSVLLALLEHPWISTQVIQEERERETIYADTNQVLTFKDLASVLDRISHPTEIEEIPLPFDPDDYPVF